MRAVLPDGEIRLQSDAGVFSADRVDPGTVVLLRAAPPPGAGATVLDLGCGYGVIACALARLQPSAQVWAVDVNERALALTRTNAERLALANVITARPDEVPGDLQLDLVVSNPPIHVGKQALHDLLLGWLDRLAPGGRALLVVHRHLGSDSLQRWLRDQGYGCERLTSVRGYRVLDVRPRPHSGRDG